MSETWTLQRVLNWTIGYFNEKHIPEPRLGAELLLAHVLGCKRIELYVQFERLLSAEERAAYRALIQRRAAREPVQYILGETEFMGLPFKVTPAALIPRPETERLVDRVYEHLRQNSHPTPSILDIGTGSGCIAVSLAKMLPEAQVWALDQSAAALELARENARRNEVSVTFRESDIFDPALSFPEKFSLLVTNPPYIARADWESLEPEVRRFEPREALFGGEDGLDFYRRIVPRARELLTPGGGIFLETGYDQAQTVAQLFAAAHFKTEIHHDYNQIERIVIAYYE